MAKALAGQPRLLLLDEVMAGLNDSELAASVEIVGTSATSSAAILWVEHVMSAVIQLAERAIVLNFGGSWRRRARGRHAGPAGRRRVSRAGARCLRSRAGGRVPRRARHRRHRRRGSHRRGGRDRRLERRGQDDAIPGDRRAAPGDGGPGRARREGSDPSSRPPHLARGNRVRTGRAAPVPGDDPEEQPRPGRLPKRPDRETLELVYDLFPRLKERQRQQAGTLSGGEQQMLAVARALMARPGCSCSTSRRPGSRR